MSVIETTSSTDAADSHRRPPPILAWLSVALRILFIVGILLAGFIGYGLIDNRWYRVLAVDGASMTPTIHSGDLIVLTRPPQLIAVGMVLTLQVDGQLVTHRVVEVAPGGSFITEGDANDVRDDFSQNQVRVVGEYRFAIPLLGNLLGGGGQDGAS